MSQTWGLRLVGIVGAILFGYHLRQFYRSYQVTFMDEVARGWGRHLMRA